MPEKPWVLYRRRPDMEHLLTAQQERSRRDDDRAIARRVLQAERTRSFRALDEYRRALDEAKADARKHKTILAEAKREGLKLLQILDWLEKKAA